MNKKFILTSVLASLIAMPEFAAGQIGLGAQNGINGSTTCDTATLGQSENNSTANVEADWNANTININWYDGENVVSTNTCTYDGTITLPTQPTKTGYTFAGWQLRAAAPVVNNCTNVNNESDCNNTTGCIWHTTPNGQMTGCYLYLDTLPENQSECGGNIYVAGNNWYCHTRWLDGLGSCNCSR